LSDERPDALLKSALEKIVYFEARAASLSSDLSTAKGELERLRTELSVAAQKEIELRREVAELEVRLAREHAEREQQARAMEALRAERATLVGRIIEASRIHDAERTSEPESLFDLAGFMSELRSEAFRHARVPAAVAPVTELVAAQVPAPQVAASVPATVALAQASLPSAAVQVTAPAVRPTSTVAHAQQFAAQGRLTVTEEELLSLSGATFTGRTEETLFGFSVRELSAPDASSRLRAAERLKALAHPAAAPALAAALNAEGEPRVLVALLDAFAGLAKAEGTPLVQRHLTSVNPDVRVAALKALLRLSPVDAIPQLSAALKDPDRAVRRRASLLALNVGGEAALDLGEQALQDADADVRALGALVLGAAAGERSRQLLLRALADRDEKVRKAAAQGLSRILGEDVSAVVGLDEAQRRRELRRISGLPERPVRAPLQPPAPPALAPGFSPAPVAAVAPVAPPIEPPAAVVAAPSVSAPEVRPEPVAASPVTVHVAPSVAAAALRPPAAPAAPHVTEADCEAVLSEVRMAIRGKLPADIARGTGLPPDVVSEACDLLVARGHAIRRGLKVFVA
jgi:hypothetical protein